MEAVKEKPRLKKYSAYEDSGMEWLGDIPEHWELIRFKYLFNELNERSIDGTEDLLSVSQYTGVTRKGDKVEEGDLLTNASTLEGYKKVQKGDLVTNIMLAWNGSLGFSPFEGITSPAYSIYKLQGNNEKRYFHYLLRTDRYKAEFKRNSSGVIDSRLRLYSDDFFRISSLLPPKQEQTAIASFLDEKCGKIDTAIAQKQKLIELLKERKPIIIQSAVTKGLDPNVKMKDSGVEWIGEIPEHWEVKKLKYLINIQGGYAFDSSDFKEEGIQIIKIANTYMNRLSLERQPTFVNSSYLISHKDWMVSKNDILMSLTGTMGKKDYGFAILIQNNEKYLLNQRVAKLTVKKKSIEPAYLLTLLHSESYLNQLYSLPAGTKQANLSNDNVVNIVMPIPPKIERRVILDHIKAANTLTEKAVELQEQQIKKLKEYKSSLIDAAVTGKIKVV